MKTVSAAFVVEQNKPQSCPVTRLYYKRRYWDTGTSAYIWEAAWTEIDRSLIQKIDAVNHQLDTQTMTEFKVSNVSIYLKNNDNVWQEWNTTTGKFIADGVSANGYEPYLTKFKITSGFSGIGKTDTRQGTVTDQGAEELITMFTGLATDWQFDSKSHIVKVVVEGSERLLVNGDAEQISTAVTLETLGTGDGIITEFYTSRDGVGKITTVTVDGTTMIPGQDYDISALNTEDSPAQISLRTPPGVGELVKCSYTYWYKNYLIETLVELLVIEAGIASYSIIAPSFGANITNNISKTSKADFDAGTNDSTIDTSTEPGTLKLDNLIEQEFSTFTGTDTTFPADWTNITSSGSNYMDIESNKLKITTTGTNACIRAKKAYGTSIGYGEWTFSFKDNGIIINAGVGLWFYADGDDDPNQNHKGYGLYIYRSAGDVLTIDLRKGNAGGDVLTTAALADGFFDDEKTIKIIRFSNYDIKVYVDNVLILTANDSTHTSCDRFVIYNIDAECFIDDIEFSKYSATGTHISATIDGSDGLISWEKLIVVEEKVNATIAYSTRTSADGISWDAWVAIGAGGTIDSDDHRYIQVKAVFTQATYIFDNPKINLYTVRFKSDQVFVSLADFTGMTCYSAIQELAKLCDFEWGVDDTEQFFFRARTPSATPDLTMAQNTNIVEISSLNYGYDNTYAIVRTNFGSFTSEASSAAGSQTSALEIYGRTVFDVSCSILINADTNIADGLATIYLARVAAKRRVLELNCIYLPQMELADTVSITFQHDPYASAAQFLSALVCKIVGIKHDPSGWTTQMTVEEIL